MTPEKFQMLERTFNDLISSEEFIKSKWENIHLDAETELAYAKQLFQIIHERYIILLII